MAFLPGIQQASLAMPDIHWGYGFCIGGVAATDPEEGGVISPGGVGYDITCGARLVRTDLTLEDVQPKIQELVNHLFKRIPAGVGEGGPFKFSRDEIRKILAEGVGFLKKRGWATDADIECTEERGCIEGADPAASQRSCHRKRFGPVRHVGLWESLLGGTGRRGNFRSWRRRLPWACEEVASA